MARNLYLFSCTMFLLAAVIWATQERWTFTAVSGAAAMAMLVLAGTPGVGLPPVEAAETAPTNERSAGPDSAVDSGAERVGTGAGA
jgi:hypothetical protein